jgi:hypothetical protein
MKRRNNNAMKKILVPKIRSRFRPRLIVAAMLALNTLPAFAQGIVLPENWTGGLDGE